jgi:AcrR family transcriptional regulator
MRLEIVGKSVEHGKRGSIQAWLDAGYSIFSSEGPASIQTERLARHLNKNKSGFYYFFKDREFFLESLMEEHLGRLNSMTNQIRQIRHFDPEYLEFLIEYKEVFFFQIQLMKNRETELFNTVLNIFNRQICAAVIPVWSDYLNTPIDVADKLWGMTRDSLYCRATATNFNFTWLRQLASEARLIVNFQNSQAMAV